MATKTNRIEARITPEERARLDRAASLSGTSTSAFMVNAAIARADEVIAESGVTVVPQDFFDHLLATLDEPDDAPGLARAAASIHPRRIATT